MALALIVVVLLVALWAGYRIYIYRKALRYSPATPSAYDLPSGLPVTIEGGQLRGLPEDVANGTLLLEIEVASSLLGHLFDPRIVVGDLEFYFERGVKATRHLVLPFPAGKFVTHRLRVGLKAKAWVYPASGIRNLAIVAPHPDDAEIAAFGVYASSPERVHILNVTRGEKGTSHRVPGLDATAQQKLVGDMRSFDARTVPLLAGMSPDHIQDLAWNEALFPLSEEKRKELANAIADFLSKTQAKQVVCPHPILDNHKVHRDVTLATIEAILSLGDPEIELFGALIHVPDRRTYPLGPMNAGVGLPPQSKSIKAFDRLETYWLSPASRVTKVFALDANHDLRPSPAPYAERDDLLSLGRRRLRERLTGALRVASLDYYRRSVRACELFLVYPYSELQTLREKLSTSS